MATEASRPTGNGIEFPQIEGKRSSQRTGKALFAEAVRRTDARLADEIEATSKWRTNYLGPVRRIVETGIGSSARALTIARDGVESSRDTLVFERNGETMGIAAAFEHFGAEGFSTATVQGRGDRPRELEIPVRGGAVGGDRLRRQLDAWVDEGTIEPSSAEAVKLVVSNPDWLDLSDLHFAVMGAASEMGPMRALSSWGATVYALDLPNPTLWEFIIDIARSGSGRVLIPTVEPVDDEASIAGKAGADLLQKGPEVASWLSSFDTSLTIGDYTYGDGTTFVRLSVAVDAVIESLRKAGRLQATAYLATPTDVFAVPEETVAGAKAKKPSLPIAGVQGLGRIATIGRLCSPNYRRTWPDEAGRQWGISDCLVPQQGANYALAKSLQRWRAICLRTDGLLTSANVAPPTRTQSVVKNPILAAAYSGAPNFGVNVFEPATSRALMSALFVHDLRNPKAIATRENNLGHPYELFSDGAAHGGIWRLHNEPRSILPLAVLIGLARRKKS